MLLLSQNLSYVMYTHVRVESLQPCHFTPEDLLAVCKTPGLLGIDDRTTDRTANSMLLRQSMVASIALALFSPYKGSSLLLESQHDHCHRISLLSNFMARSLPQLASPTVQVIRRKRILVPLPVNKRY